MKLLSGERREKRTNSGNAGMSISFHFCTLVLDFQNFYRNSLTFVLAFKIY